MGEKRKDDTDVRCQCRERAKEQELKGTRRAQGSKITPPVGITVGVDRDNLQVPVQDDGLVCYRERKEIPEGNGAATQVGAGVRTNIPALGQWPVTEEA